MPWAVCFMFFTAMHCVYPADYARAKDMALAKKDDLRTQHTSTLLWSGLSRRKSLFVQEIYNSSTIQTGQCGDIFSLTYTAIRSGQAVVCTVINQLHRQMPKRLTSNSQRLGNENNSIRNARKQYRTPWFQNKTNKTYASHAIQTWSVCDDGY